MQRNDEVMMVAANRLALVDIAELAVAARRLVFKNSYNNEVFRHCIKVLSKYSHDEFIRVLRALYSRDKREFENYLLDDSLFI